MSMFDVLAELQRLEGEMLTHLDEVSRATGQRYFAAYGTALGAVRDGAHIPWDPDMDVLVPVEDYQALLRELAQRLPAEYEVLTPETETHYEPLFARIGVRGVPHAFLHVDLFELCGAPSSRVLQRVHYRLNRVLARTHSAKRVAMVDRPYWGARQRALTVLIRVLSAPVSPRTLRRVHRYLNRRPTSGSAWVCNTAGTYGRREYLRREIFGGGKPGQLGKSSVQLPADADGYLRYVYGEDYLIPVPPEAQQRAYEHFAKHMLPRLEPLLPLPGS